MVVIPRHSYYDESNFSWTVEYSVSTVRFFFRVALYTVTWACNNSSRPTVLLVLTANRYMLFCHGNEARKNAGRKNITSTCKP